jgi:hypothetical protein
MKEKNTRSQVWQCIPVIPALRRLREEDLECEANLAYIEKKNRKRTKKERKVRIHQGLLIPCLEHTCILNLVLPTSNLGHNLPSPGLEDLFPTD